MQSAAAGYAQDLSKGSVSPQTMNNLVSALTTYVGVLKDVGVADAVDRYIAANPTAFNDFAISSAQMTAIEDQMVALGGPPVDENELDTLFNPTGPMRSVTYTTLKQMGFERMMNRFISTLSSMQQTGTIGMLGTPRVVWSSYHPLSSMKQIMFYVAPKGDCNFIEAFGITSALFGFELIAAICGLAYAMYCEE